MKKLISLCGAALVALLAVAGLAPAAHAYPDVNIDLTVNRQVLYGGETFTATGTSDVTCAWHLTWNGVVRTGTGSNGAPFQTTYTAPAVTKITKIPLHGTCTYTQPTARKAAKAARTAAASATWQRTIMITVLPRGSAVSPPENSGDLPNTGGPKFIVLLGGVALLLAGAGAVVVARRRAENTDTAAGQA
jgi:LPXTG-motif cell wall-anchored protein